MFFNNVHMRVYTDGDWVGSSSFSLLFLILFLHLLVLIHYKQKDSSGISSQEAVVGFLKVSLVVDVEDVLKCESVKTVVRQTTVVRNAGVSLETSTG